MHTQRKTVPLTKNQQALNEINKAVSDETLATAWKWYLAYAEKELEYSKNS